jgi:hypothetical protein
MLYPCHDLAYHPDGIIDSLKDKSFREVWFSKKTADYFNNFDAQKSCEGFQCSSEKRNINIHALLESFGDPFI